MYFDMSKGQYANCVTGVPGSHPVVPQNMSPVVGRLNDLEKSLSGIGELTRVLRDRLDPVIVSPSMSSTSEKEAAAPVMSPLEERVMRLTADADDCCGALSALIDSLRI